VGRSLQEFTSPEAFQLLKEQTRKRLAGEKSTYELEITCPDGEKHQLLVTAAPWLNKDGVLVGATTMFRDITERKKAEEALKESEQRFRAVFDGVNDGILVADVETRKFHLGNNAICRMLGYRAEDIKNLGVVDIHPKESLPYVTEQFDRLARHEIGADTEVPVKRRDGSIFYVDITPSSLTLAGRTCLVGVFRDITERKRAEEAYRAVVQHTLQGLAILQDNRIVFANQALLEMSGYSLEETLSLLPNDVIATIHAEDRERVLTGMQDLLAGKPVSSPQVSRLIRKDGATRWVEILASRIEYQGKPAIQVAYSDITERKKAEEELREKEALYRRLAENTQDMVSQTDAEGIIRYASPSHKWVLGYESEYVVGKSIFDNVHPDDLSKVVAAVKTAIESRSSGRIEYRCKHADGHYRWLESTGNVLVGEDGEVIGATISTRDITERRRQREEQQIILDSVPAMVFYKDRDNRFIRVNKALADLTGKSKEEIEGTSAFETYSEHAEEYWRDDKEVMASGRPKTHIIEPLETPQGTRWVETDKIPYRDADGNVIGIIGFAIDITERKQAEDALRERAEELGALQATVLDITGQRDLPALLHAIVERAAQLLGVTSGGMYLCDPEKREVRCVVSYNTPYDYRGVVLKYGEGAAGRVAETGRPIVVDDYRLWKGRAAVYEKDKPFSAVLTAPMIWKGSVIGVIHVMEESKARRFTEADQELLTLFGNHAAIAVENARLLEQEKHHAEKLARYSTNLERLVSERTSKLAESEKRFRELADLLPQIVFETDEEGNLQFMNRAAFASTGRSEEEFRKGMNAFELFAPEEHERAVQGILRITAGETIGGREFTLVRRDGTTCPVLVYTAPVMRLGKAVGLRGIAIDITERRKMEEELREAKERLEYLITSNPAAIYTGKPLGDLSDWHLTYLSQRVKPMLGFEPWEFIGDPEFWKHHVHPEDLALTMAQVPRLWKKGQHTFEYRFQHKDGTYRWIREEATVVPDANGKPIEVNGYWIDVTERKRLEEALAKSQRLATIGELAAMVGHDLRNPMQGIAGAVYYLRTDGNSKLSKEGKEMIQTIQESIEHSDKIITDLLEYSRQLHLELSRTNVKSITEDALARLKIPKGVRVINSTKNQPMMKLDVYKMRRVFMNLIRNAVDAMPKGGTLTITSTRSGDNLRIAFKDTGEGMTTESLAKLWSPLFTTKAKGMGLGLAIIKRFVEAHEGSISVETEIGKGSTFTVTLPIKPTVKGEAKKK
jgi:PAS domain S-box-containing protein